MRGNIIIVHLLKGGYKKLAKNYKKPSKLKDVSRVKKAERLAKAATGSKSIFYADLKRKAKVANQRLVRLEKADKKSPAYLAVQAKLEILGRAAGKSKGRRFSETGRATYNEYQALSKVLDEFISQKTSTVKGYSEYVDAVWAGALKSENISIDLEKAGITKEQWFEMWSSLPDKNKRTFDSSEYIEALALYNVRGGKVKGKAISVSKMIEEFNNADTMKNAYKAAGITAHDYEIAEELGIL